MQIHPIQIQYTYTAEELLTMQAAGRGIYQRRLDAMREALVDQALLSRERDEAGLPPLTAGLDGLFSPVKKTP